MTRDKNEEYRAVKGIVQSMIAGKALSEAQKWKVYRYLDNNPPNSKGAARKS